MAKRPPARRKGGGEDASPNFALLRDFRNVFVEHCKELGAQPAAYKAFAAWLKEQIDDENVFSSGVWYLTHLRFGTSTFAQIVIADVGFGPACTTALCSAVASNFGFLAALRLWRSESLDAGARAVAELVRASPHLLVAELLDIRMTAAACETLGNALQTNNTLQTLALDHNALGDDGMDMLAHGLKWNITLTTLSLQFCAIGERGAAAIARHVLPYSRVTSLNLYGNLFGDKGLYALATTLARNSALQTLNLGYNLITGERAKAASLFAAALRAHGALQTLELDGNLLNAAAARLLVDAFRDTLTLKVLTMTDRLSLELIEELKQIAASRVKARRRGRGGSARASAVAGAAGAASAAGAAGAAGSGLAGKDGLLSSTAGRASTSGLAEAIAAAAAEEAAAAASAAATTTARQSTPDHGSPALQH